MPKPRGERNRLSISAKNNYLLPAGIFSTNFWRAHSMKTLFLPSSGVLWAGKARALSAFVGFGSTERVRERPELSFGREERERGGERGREKGKRGVRDEKNGKKRGGEDLKVEEDLSFFARCTFLSSLSTYEVEKDGFIWKREWNLTEWLLSSSNQTKKVHRFLSAGSVEN